MPRTRRQEHFEVEECKRPRGLKEFQRGIFWEPVCGSLFPRSKVAGAGRRSERKKEGVKRHANGGKRGRAGRESNRQRASPTSVMIGA